MDDDKLYDGRWVLFEKKKKEPHQKCYVYFFKNIYNNEIVKISNSSYTRIRDGKTTITSILSFRLGKRQKAKFKKKHIYTF